MQKFLLWYSSGNAGKCHHEPYTAGRKDFKFLTDSAPSAAENINIVRAA